MPLPPPDCAREPWHERAIQIRAFRRGDGLFDIEGRLTDVWPVPVPNGDTMLPAGEPMHAMNLRFTVDLQATIVAVAAAMDAGPYGEGCTAIAPDYHKLVGLRIGRGYREAIRQLFGRTAGCTHMNELANVMGSAAMQALWDDMPQDPDQKPMSIDGCHALRADGPQVAKFYPRWHRDSSSR